MNNSNYINEVLSMSTFLFHSNNNVSFWAFKKIKVSFALDVLRKSRNRDSKTTYLLNSQSKDKITY